MYITKNLYQLNADQYLFIQNKISIRTNMNTLICSCGTKGTCQHIAYIQSKVYKQKKPRILRL